MKDKYWFLMLAVFLSAFMTLIAYVIVVCRYSPLMEEWLRLGFSWAVVILLMGFTALIFYDDYKGRQR